MIVRLPMVTMPSSKNATARNVHPKPISSTRWWTIIGSTTPPMLEPDAMMPIARARCRRNHVEQAVIAERIRQN